MPGKETFGPFFEADIRTPFFFEEVLTECALHLLAEKGGLKPSDSESQDLKDMERFGCPKSPI